MLAEIDLTMLRTGHRGVAYLITKCGRHRSSQSSGAANAVLETQESTLLRVVTRQLQVVNGEKSRKSRADGRQCKNGSGAEAPNPLNELREFGAPGRI